MIGWLQGRWCKPSPFRADSDPAAKRAVVDAQHSLEKAQETATQVNEVVRSVRAEEERNHFIELIYGIDSRRKQ